MFLGGLVLVFDEEDEEPNSQFVDFLAGAGWVVVEVLVGVVLGVVSEGLVRFAPSDLNWAFTILSIDLMLSPLIIFIRLSS